MKPFCAIAMRVCLPALLVLLVTGCRGPAPRGLRADEVMPMPWLVPSGQYLLPVSASTPISPQQWRELDADWSIAPCDDSPHANQSRNSRPEVQWYRLAPRQGDIRVDISVGAAWDRAHELGTRLALKRNDSAAGPLYVEPDFIINWPTDTGPANQDSRHPPEGDPMPDFLWHQGDDYTQLAAARQQVGDKASDLLLAVLDTGWLEHCYNPRLRLDLAYDFWDGDGDAQDTSGLTMGRQHGHGTRVTGLLAGDGPDIGWRLGGSPASQVVPIRISDTVVHFSTSSMYAGIRHAVAIGCDVVSISQGGIPSLCWADAVNEAYEAGVVLVAAAGNNWCCLPTRYTVYPARFRRVLGVTGIMRNGQPYRFRPCEIMQGSWGPDAVMPSFISACAPRVWTMKPNSPDDDACRLDDFNGTSAATPQVAAAAALWLAENGDKLPAMPRWKRAEAVYQALLSQADPGELSTADVGAGMLKAKDSLAYAQNPDTLVPQARARVSFPWLRVLFGFEEDLERPVPIAGRRAHLAMLETEAAQLAMTDPDVGVPLEWLHDLLVFPDKLEADKLGRHDVNDQNRLFRNACELLLNRLADHPAASAALREVCDSAMARTKYRSRAPQRR